MRNNRGVQVYPIRVIVQSGFGVHPYTCTLKQSTLVGLGVHKPQPTRTPCTLSATTSAVCTARTPLYEGGLQ